MTRPPRYGWGLAQAAALAAAVILLVALAL